MRFFLWLLDICYCLPEDEYRKENTDDTIVPDDFIPVNENNHDITFNGSEWSQFIRNT